MKNLIKISNLLLQGFALGLLYLYRFLLSPLIGPACRFQPTCSQYAIAAIKTYGPFKGGSYTLKRLSKCHPWGKSGYDPLPTQKT